jgi:hypothetical protein
MGLSSLQGKQIQPSDAQRASWLRSARDVEGEDGD